jgi:GGDEF domain-containing protein
MIDKKAYIFRFTHQNRDGGFLILIPQIHELDHLKPEVIKKIEQICQTISIYLGFLNKNQSVDNTYKDLFVHIEQFVRTLINNNIKEGKKATLSLFQFHSFDRYFAGMGKNFSRELLHDISQIFRSRLKKNDLLFIFSPEEYLLISLDSSPEEIRNRFPQKSFSVKGLIMTFSYNTATYDKTILMSQDLWSKLYYS